MLLTLRPRFSAQTIVFRALSTFDAMNLSCNVAPSLSLPDGVLLVVVVFANHVKPVALLNTFVGRGRERFCACPSRRVRVGWRLVVGGWRLVVGGWRLAVGGWLVVGGWLLAAVRVTILHGRGGGASTLSTWSTESCPVTRTVGGFHRAWSLST